jgi:cell division protein FtsB
MLLAPAALLVVALALATNVLPLRQIVAQRQEIAATQERLDGLVADNDALDNKVDSLANPIEIERIARDDLGYVRPGETAYVVIDPDAEDDQPAMGATGGTAETDRTQDSAPAADDASVATRVWNFLTGRDLASTE